MKKLLFLSVFLFLATFSIKAQTTDSLVGNWKFKDIYNAEKQNAEMVGMLRELFSDMKLELAVDKKYKFHLLEETGEGKWSFDSTTKIVTLKSSIGEEKFEVINVSSNQLAISIAKGKSFILERVIAKKP